MRLCARLIGGEGMRIGRDYYNDNDPGAAAWLRELIKSGLGLQADSSSGQEAHGRLGREPTPFQANGNLLNCARSPFGQSQAYARRQERDALRSTRIFEVRLGLFGKTGQYCCPEASSPLSALDISPPDGGAFREMCELTSRQKPFGIHLNIATYFLDRAQSQSEFRTFCNREGEPVQTARSSFYFGLCSEESSISDGYDCPAFPRHTLHNGVA